YHFMKWKGRRKSSNVDDRRGSSTGKIAAGGGIVAIIFLAIQLFTGGDAGEILDQFQQQQMPAGEERELSSEEIEVGEFTKVVLADTEDIWQRLFQQNGATYQEPGMVLFDNAVNTDCGSASSAAGPFYCPADQTIYMDLRFFEE